MGILLICSMSLLIVGLDITIVNVALPSIGRSLHSSVSGLQWVIDVYTLVLASFLMLSGSTADRLGRRRTFVVGLLLFVSGSFLCSLAPSLELLVTFRIVQALGGSMLNPVAMSIITNTFTKPRERAQAIGVWGAVIGISMALGPVVGGLLVTTVGWRSIFWINIPVGLAAVVLTLRYVPESRASRVRALDPPGQAMVVVLLACLTYVIIEFPAAGWTAARILVPLAAAVISLVGLLVIEPRRKEPLLDLRFFRSIPFSGATVVAVTAFASLGGFLFLNTLYLQETRGLSALDAGLDTLPMAAMAMLWPPISGRIVGRHGARLPLVVAGVFLTAGTVMLAGITATTAFSWLFAAYTIFGIGYGMVNAPITNTAVTGMPRDQAGVAAGVASTSRQIGQTLGVAVVGALVTAHLHGSLATELPAASRAGWWVLSGCGLSVLAMGITGTTARARESARRTATLLNPEALAHQQSL
ncbi:MAG: MFS transporter [Actinomycetota bacterium]|nr:MFS transporter [Actinomycetota bacterium]